MLLMVHYTAIGKIYLNCTLPYFPFGTNMCPLIKHYIIMPLPTGMNDKICTSLLYYLFASRGG